MMTDRAVIYLEIRTFFRQGIGPAAMAVLLLAVLAAGFSGAQWRDARLASVDGFETAELAEMAQWRETLAAIEAGTHEAKPGEARPMSISFPAALRPAALGDFAIGHGELQPATGEISPWRNAATIFRRYQFDNPTTLLMGRFDVSLVVVMLLPLLMIAVSFDALARDHGSGTLAMMLSAPVSIVRLVWTRLLFRNGLLILAALAGMLVLLPVNDAGGDRYGRFALWLTVTFTYWALWLAVIACVIARIRTSISTAAALVTVWLLLVLALPASVDMIAEAAFPTPSRLSWLSEIRHSAAETNRSLDRLTQGFLVDHPGLTVSDGEVPSFLRAGYLANEIARENTQPIVDAYASAHAGRARILRLARLLSPAIMAQHTLSVIAGADLARQHRFQSQARDALQVLADTVGPAVVSRNRLALAQFDALSPFEFEDRTMGELTTHVLWCLALMFFAGAVALLISLRLLRSAPDRLLGS